LDVHAAPSLSTGACHDSTLVLLSFPTRRSSDLLVDLCFVSVQTFRDGVGHTADNGGKTPVTINGHLFWSAVDSVTEIDEVCVEADRKSTRLNSSHVSISYAVFCSKKKTTEKIRH